MKKQRSKGSEIIPDLQERIDKVKKESLERYRLLPFVGHNYLYTKWTPGIRICRIHFMRRKSHGTID